MDNKFEQLESDVMMRIIAEDSSVSNILERQYNSAKVIGRRFTGVGFFTDLEVLDKSLKLSNHPNLELGNVQANIEGLKFGAGFVLFIRDGLIETLEGYTYDEPWPTIISEYNLE